MSAARPRSAQRLRATATLPAAVAAVAAVAALCAAFGLSGCVDQSKEVGLYRGILDNGRPAPRPLQPGEPLALDRALALANADYEPLSSQGETYLQALIEKNRAFSAFLPSVSFQPNFTVEQAPRGSGAGAAAGAPATSAAAVAASQGGYVQDGRVLRRLEAPVVGSMDLAYRNVPLLKGAEMAIAQQRQLLLDAQSTVLLNVAQTYFQILISTRQEGVLRHSLELQEARVRDLEGRLRARLALPLEVSQARANEAATRVLLEQASNDVRNGRRTLAVLIGAPRVDGPLTDATAVFDDRAPVDGFVSRALAGRQDLLAAHSAVEAARYAVKASVAEYYPSVSASLAGFLYRENYPDATKWDGLLAANLPIFSAGQIRADVRTAWSRFRPAALAESLLRRQIEQGIRTAYDNLATSRAVLGDLSSEVEAATQAYTQALQMERNGLAIPLDVLTAQDALLNAQLQFADESLSRTVFYLDLIRATGELSPETIPSLHWVPMPSAKEAAR